MTVMTSYTPAVYQGNGTATVFPFPFRIFADTDLVVTRTEGTSSTTLTLGTGYTVSNQNVVLPSALLTGQTLVIQRVIPVVQETSFLNQGAFFPEAHEDALDRAIMAIQEISYNGVRSLRMPPQVSEPATELPPPDPGHALVWRADGKGFENAGVASATLQQDLADTTDPGKGATAIGFRSSAAGAQATTLRAKAEMVLDAVIDFGCDNTGSSNTTDKLLAFYSACIAGPRAGHIPAGTYKVTPGVLLFNTNFTDKPWPNITTDNYSTTIFLVDSATATNSPVLQWTNGTATSASTYFWRGGTHGGLTIRDTTGATSVGRHGIALTGVYGLKFGFMFFDGVRGSGICVLPALYGGSNPDPYACSFLSFEGIEGCNCGRFTLENLNYVGMDSWDIKVFRSISCGLGGWYGIGSGNKCHDFSCYGLGWAFDDGMQAAAPTGPPQRNWFGIAECDNCQYGIRINKISLTTFDKWRFVHRYNTSPNTASEYWPRTAIDVNGGASPSCINNYLNITHRIEGGGALGTLGTFMNLHNDGNIASTLFNIDYQDNGSIGVTDALMFSNLSNSNQSVSIIKKGKELANIRDNPMGVLFGSAAVTLVPNTGYGTTSAVLAMASQPFATYSAPMTLATSTFTASRRGLYELTLKLPMTLAVGTRVRLGFIINGTTTTGTVHAYQSNASIQTYVTVAQVVLNAGDTVRPIADQNTASATVAVSPNFSNDECQFTVKAL